VDKKTTMQDFFDKLAPSWDNNEQEYDARERLTNMIDLQKNSLIADIGCGTGVMFEHLLKTEPRGILAIDISGEMIKRAKDLYSDTRIVYLNEDLLTASLPVLDAAILFNAYPHFTDKKALSEKLSKHIRVGGCIVIAHSRSREQINGIHKSDDVCQLSMKLRPAETEATEFLPFFEPEKMVDNDELYFIKMMRV
jgi:SAM-dependent methyltransferase